MKRSALSFFFANDGRLLISSLGLKKKGSRRRHRHRHRARNIVIFFFNSRRPLFFSPSFLLPSYFLVLFFLFCRLTRAGQRLNPFMPSPLVFPSPWQTLYSALLFFPYFFRLFWERKTFHYLKKREPILSTVQQWTIIPPTHKCESMFSLTKLQLVFFFFYF